MKKNVPSYGKLSFLCCMSYFTCHLTRGNYAAALTEIIKDLEISKSLASLAVTGSFIALWIGQVVAGVMGDHIKPRRLVTIGLAAATAINIAMGFMSNIWVMTVLWTINGFFQAFLWPPMTRVMAENMDAHQYAKTAIGISLSSTASSVLIYLLVPVAILASGWRLAFWGAGAVGLAACLLWAIGTRGVREGTPLGAKDLSKKTGASVSLGKVILLSGLLPLFIAQMALGALRDGVMTWMPTFIFDQYHLSPSFSIFTTALLPLFGMAGVLLAGKMEQRSRNLTKTSTVLFIVCAVAIAVMLPFYDKSVVLCILLISVLVGCAYGVTHLLTGQLPSAYSKYGCVSTISGLTTAVFYLGSTISTYGFAILTDRSGWFVTIASWLVLSGIGILTCAVNIKRWFRFEHGDE